ncbi:MAG: SDR family NAD(P)-dependent oxidoreductase [Gammaproteobacteria bacterium]
MSNKIWFIVTDQKQIHAVVNEAMKLFGRIDVLVNNAGYGILCAVEEVPTAEGHKLFETNFFGLWEVIRAVLPIMRKQKTGHIINISSVAGITGMAGSGLYNASKFAVEGLSEALAQEVTPLGIKVTIIEPGPFWTDFAGSSLKTFGGIQDYDATRGVSVSTIENYDGKQPGDPEKAAEAIYMLTNINQPPLHLLLGKLAVERIRLKLSDLSEQVSG